MQGTIQSIFLAPEQGATVVRREAVTAVAGRGLEGDRYFHGEGSIDRAGDDVTLIEAELLEGVESEFERELGPGVHRRNLTTSGIELDPLVDERFRIGDIICVGTEPCEPCSYLESHLERRGVDDVSIPRGGIRARIVESGRIHVGDRIEAL